MHRGVTVAEHVPAWLLYALVAICISVVGLSVAGWLYVNSLNEDTIRQGIENDQKWCGVVTTLDNAYNQQPTRPTTQIGLELARQIHELRVQFSCP